MKRKGSRGTINARNASKKPKNLSRVGRVPHETVNWPEYFHDLFKVFQALNTVLAFISSRKHLAVTFPAVRSSVEGLLKRPLDLEKVAELKALLPALIQFAYIPRGQLPTPAERLTQTSRSRQESPDFSLTSQSGESEDEHVLVLEFAGSSRGKKARAGPSLSLPPAMSPVQAKSLVECRNEQFKHAVNELILATPESENPVILLQSAARDHIPIKPKAKVGSSQTAPLKVPTPENRPSVNEVIQYMQEDERYQGQIVDRRTFHAKEAKEGFLDEPLSQSITQSLRNSRTVTSFYTHQAEAVNSIFQKKHVIVSTSTASGKSLIYQVPVLRFLEEDLSATAMFVYPTKALAQDQMSSLEHLLRSCVGFAHIKIATYDGDTPQERRGEIRAMASVIFTNFDTIHASILPHEELWRSFFQNLKIFAVDELHCYSDLMGSHVAQVIRRLRRICAAVGSHGVIFVSCSATITKPAQHMKQIFGVEEAEEITEDGAPSGCKDYLIWNPPYLAEQTPELGQRSAMSEAVWLMRFLMKRGIRVILFCKIRKACELVTRALHVELSAEGRLDILSKVMPYRGGYSQEERRSIEREAFSGNLLGIIATNALELGIDIGVLDAVIMLGFPHSLASFRQQAGRAGRRSRDSLVILVSDNLPLDQYYRNNPDDLYNKAIDELVIDLDSKEIIEAHLQCAAHELPLSKDDSVYFGPRLLEICDNQLVRDGDGWYHPHPRWLPYPPQHVSIRGAEEEKYTAVDITYTAKASEDLRILEEIEHSRALFEIYEGGVFLHQGLTFIVKEVDHDTKIAKLHRADVSWITSPRDFTDVDAQQTHRIKDITGSPHHVFYGRIRIVTVVYGFYKTRNKEILDVVDLYTPPWESHSTGLWIDLPKKISNLLRLKRISLAAAIHSACHAWMNCFSLAAQLRTECKAPEKEYKAAESQRKRPARLIFYESLGKNGVSIQAFEHAPEILRRAQLTVESCSCSDGCSKCIFAPGCRENNVVSSKIGALVILRGLLNLDIDLTSIPTQLEESDGFDTIIDADYVRPIGNVTVEVG